MISSKTSYSVQAQISNQNELAKQITALQESVATGKRLSAPSDDPAAALRVSQIRTIQADQVVWTNNANMGTSIASTVDTSLGNLQDLMNRANELVLSGRNDTTSDTDRAAITSELQSIVDSLNSAQAATDPTGAPLYPTGSPLQIPVSSTLNLAATASSGTVFGVTTASGTQTMQQILTSAITAINGNPGTRAADIQTSLDAISAANNHLDEVRADQGVRMKRLSDATDALTASGESLSEERNGLEGTDLTYAVSEFQAKQTALQAAQTMFAQTNKSNLFSLLG